MRALWIPQMNKRNAIGTENVSLFSCAQILDTESGFHYDYEPKQNNKNVDRFKKVRCLI